VNPEAVEAIVLRIEQQIRGIESRLDKLGRCVTELKGFRSWTIGAIAGLGTLGFLTGLVALVIKAMG
jgi:hypothetical protein